MEAEGYEEYMYLFGEESEDVVEVSQVAEVSEIDKVSEVDKVVEVDKVAEVAKVAEIDKVATGGIYIKGTPDDIARYAGNRILLFFHASWCPSCRQADKDIKKRQQDIPDDLVILNINYDQHGDWGRKNYGVTYQHRFVQVDGSGNEITGWSNGYFDEILENIK